MNLTNCKHFKLVNITIKIELNSANDYKVIAGKLIVIKSDSTF